jgi:hypothetical protein
MSKLKKPRTRQRAKQSTLRGLAAALAISLLFPIVLFFAAEGCLSLALNHPRLIPKGYPLNLLRYYYDHFDRDVIQFSAACARYDPGLYWS